MASRRLPGANATQGHAGTRTAIATGRAGRRRRPRAAVVGQLVGGAPARLRASARTSDHREGDSRRPRMTPPIRIPSVSPTARPSHSALRRRGLRPLVEHPHPRHLSRQHAHRKGNVLGIEEHMTPPAWQGARAGAGQESGALTRPDAARRAMSRPGRATPIRPPIRWRVLVDAEWRRRAASSVATMSKAPP